MINKVNIRANIRANIIAMNGVYDRPIILEYLDKENKHRVYGCEVWMNWQEMTEFKSELEWLNAARHRVAGSIPAASQIPRVRCLIGE